MERFGILHEGLRGVHAEGMPEGLRVLRRSNHRRCCHHLLGCFSWSVKRAFVSWSVKRALVSEACHQNPDTDDVATKLNVCDIRHKGCHKMVYRHVVPALFQEDMKSMFLTK